MRSSKIKYLLIVAVLGLIANPSLAWDNIIDCAHSGNEYTSTLRLEGPRWNNTLVKNCKIHDAPGDGILLRNVSNVRIENCEIYQLGGRGIKLSNIAGGSMVEITGNYIHDIFEDGIIAAQNKTTGVDWPGTVITGNRIERTARNLAWPGHVHGLYISSSDSLIENNIIDAVQDGTGINVRSSSVIRGNTVSNTGKAGISYYVDHDSGATDLVRIENNSVSAHHQNFRLKFAIGAISLAGANSSSIPVNKVIIRNNMVTITNSSDPAIEIDPMWKQPGSSVQQYGNVRLE